jgi:hypothetical protein
LQLAEAMSQNDPAGARKVLEKTRDVASAMRLQAAVQGADQLMPIIGGDSLAGKQLPLVPSPAPSATKRP